jgi:hypothetical protein
MYNRYNFRINENNKIEYCSGDHSRNEGCYWELAKSCEILLEYMERKRKKYVESRKSN